MNCDLCKAQEVLTEDQKTAIRKDWAGVDFYPAICADCFNTQKEII